MTSFISYFVLSPLLRDITKAYNESQVEGLRNLISSAKDLMTDRDYKAVAKWADDERTFDDLLEASELVRANTMNDYVLKKRFTEVKDCYEVLHNLALHDHGMLRDLINQIEVNSTPENYWMSDSITRQLKEFMRSQTEIVDDIHETYDEIDKNTD